jgi:flagellar biosynthesis anti-sigma factor FlgM
MKIESNGLNRIYNPEPEGAYHLDKAFHAEDAAGGAGSLKGKDRATVSRDALVLSKAAKKMSEVPEVRKDLVERFQQEIESGVYQVPIEQLAKQLMRGLMS